MSDDERLQEMTRLYVEAGLSYTQIGEQFGISRQRVGQLLAPLNLSQNVVGRRSAERAQRLVAAARRIEAGEATFEQVAAELGYASGDSVRTQMHEVGVRPHQPRKPPEHGTVAAYRAGCRCLECRRANRDYQASLKGQEPPEHGTASGYLNYACRCKACKEAARLQRRAVRRRNRGISEPNEGRE